MVGLPIDNELVVRMFKPQILATAYSLSKLQVATNEAVKKKYKAPLLHTLKNKVVTPHAALVRNRLSQKEMEEKRAKNLCFYCDQRYVPGHKSIGQVYLLEVIANEDEYILLTANEENYELNQLLIEVPQISLHALIGVQNYQTMRVIGLVGKMQLHI
ncbi:hypothetical protein Tco_0701509 [Tanacetum coccineum]